MWTVTKQLKLILLAAVCLIGLMQPAAGDVLDPFQARYSVARGSLTLGSAAFSLKPWGDKNCLVYHGVAKPRAIVNLFIGAVEDTSYFCPGDGTKLIPHHYRHVEKGDEEDSYTLDFDWQNGKVTYHNQETKTFSAPDGAVEPFLIQMAARAWLAQTEDPAAAGEKTFVLVDEDEIKHYKLATSPGGEVKTPAGPYETVKIERVDDPDKRLILWAAPELDFLPVRVERHKKDKAVISMELTDISPAPKPAGKQEK